MITLKQKMNSIPSESNMSELLGPALFDLWQALCLAIDEQYETDHVWNAGGRNWDYEYKYRRGRKTLCSMYARKNCIGFMIILGKAERAGFEDKRSAFSDTVRMKYDEAQTYHDGKWIMFEPTDTSEFDEYLKLLAIKRKPNRKQFEE